MGNKRPAKTDIGKYFDSYCEAHGLTLEEFANQVGISYSVLQKARANTARPSRETIVKVAAYTKDDLRSLLAYDMPANLIHDPAPKVRILAERINMLPDTQQETIERLIDSMLAHNRDE